MNGQACIHGRELSHSYELFLHYQPPYAFNIPCSNVNKSMEIQRSLHRFVHMLTHTVHAAHASLTSQHTITRPQKVVVLQIECTPANNT